MCQSLLVHDTATAALQNHEISSLTHDVAQLAISSLGFVHPGVVSDPIKRLVEVVEIAFPLVSELIEKVESPMRSLARS